MVEQDCQERQWFLVATKPKQETRAIEHLQNQSLDVFAPQLLVERVNRGKRVCREEPMFPGYVFVASSKHQPVASVRSTRGVRDYVRFNGQPAKVSPKVIEEIQTRVSSRASSQTVDSQLPKMGEKVRLVDGPFAGIEAIFESLDGEERVILLLNILGKTQRLSVSLKEVSTNL